MLAAPIDAKPPATPAANRTFGSTAVPPPKPVAPQKNGKHEEVSQKPPAAPPQTTSAPPKPSEHAPMVQPVLSPQWKIVSAAESLAASDAQASSASAQAPVAQAPAPAAPPASAPPVATPADANAAAQIAPQPAPTGPPPKLTPYAPAKWDSADEVTVPVHATRANSARGEAPATAEKVSAPIPLQEAAQPSSPASVVRERQRIELARRRPHPGLLIVGLAAAAIVIGIIIFKPSPRTQAPSTTPVSVAPPVVALNPTQAVHAPVAQTHVAIKSKLTVKPTPNVAGTSAPAPSSRPATPAPAAAAPARPKPAAQKPPVAVAQPPAAPRHVARYGKLYQPESGSVVALGGIEAFYGPRGRAVRVIWSAAEQASASVSLIDDRGSTVNSVNVRGGRQSVILYLPHGYHGGLTVQVSSIGRLGERVAQTTSLPPFGY